ncbi:MAG: hypothetical protein WDO71_26815 [Bacteroidota bacterium]
MAIKIIFLFTLLAYSIIVSQSFMYILALKDVQLTLEAGPYTELRKLIDASMRGNFKYVVYAALLTSLLLVLSTIKNPDSLLFITAAIAFVALIADTLLTVKGNLPVNDIINSWSSDNAPANWKDYRAKWFTIFQYRQIANITGFVSLLIGAVFGLK